MSHQLADGRSFMTLNVLDLRTAGNCETNAENDFNHLEWTYNNERPNMAIGRITPVMKLKQAA